NGYALPVFYDHHLHFIGLGERQSSLSVEHSQTLQEAHRQIADAATHDTTTTLFVLTNEQLTQSITSQLLDVIVTERPIVVFSSCRHALCMNHVARAQVQGQWTEEDILDHHRNANGVWNGWLTDAVAERVRVHFLTYTEDQMLHYMKLAKDACYARGIAGVVTEDLHYYGNANAVINAYERLTNDSNQPFAIHYLVHHREFDRVQSRLGKPTPYVSSGATKIFVDGTFGQKTAATTIPYIQGGNGQLVHSSHELQSIVRHARAHCRAVAFHCIGDAALDAVITVLRTEPNQTKLRDRIIHATMIRPEQWTALHNLHVQLDVQPGFIKEEECEKALLSTPFSGDYNDWTRASTYNIPVYGSSDAPIDTICPWSAIASMLDNRPDVDIQSAIELYINPGGIFPETNALIPGAPPSFQIINHNPFQANNLRQTDVVEFILNGKSI
ncbi:MAG: amidohydrolase family protein, partial [Bacilli bacterium]